VRFHAGGSNLADLTTLLKDVGFSDVETQKVRPARFSFFPGAFMGRAYKR
jgi:hypothetical protein